jgi:hypothetical protein
MTRILLVLLFLLQIAHSQDYLAQVNTAINQYYKDNTITPNNWITEDQFIRRAYLQIAGRIPTIAEYNEYQKDKTLTKRTTLIRKLVASPDYTNHWYNYWSDQLRTKDRISQINYMSGDPYIQWIKDSITNNIPYDKFVQSLLTAEGKYVENGAVGYFYRDFGMPLDNLIGTTKIFAGINISCAQCHDDPFQDWSQYQFYESAAYFTQIDLSRRDPDVQKRINDIKAELYDKLENETKSTLDENQKKKNRGFSGQVQQFLSASQISIKIKPDSTIKLPSTYKYPDAKPNDIVPAKPLIGEYANKNTSNLRFDYVNWLISSDFFAQNFVNRSWGFIFGAPLIAPVDNFNSNKNAKELKLLTTLSKIFVAMNYDVKAFTTVLYQSQLFHRQSWMGNSLSLYSFQGPIYRRLTAEQFWDNVVTLNTSAPNTYKSYYSDNYKQLMTIQWDTLNADSASQLYTKYSELNKNRFFDTKKYKQFVMVRAAEINDVSSPNANLLKMFGRSDRELIGASSTEGSVTQVISFMNGPFTEIVLDKESQLMKDLKTITSKSAQTDYVFKAILQRQPALTERAFFDKYSIDDLIWALLNSQEAKFN